MNHLFRFIITAFFVVLHATLNAGNQQYEVLSASIRTTLQQAISGQIAPIQFFTEGEDKHLKKKWLQAMLPRLEHKIKDPHKRLDLLKTVLYEATRSGLDPQLILSLIQVESNFKKYAISRAGARGLMQIMPFWIDVIGSKNDNLFHMKTNLRYGCTILRHYLDIEKGDLFRALGRYNGSLGKARYPNLVLNAWEKNWKYLESITTEQTKSSSH